MAAGNAYLPAFMADYNRRFGVAPRNPADAHREVLHDERELDLILCEQHVRKVTGNLSISFEGRTYQVTGHGKGYGVRGAAVTVCKGFDGAVTVLRGGRELPVRLLGEGEDPSPVEDGKSVRQRVDRAKAEQRSRPAWKPPPDHPWRRPFKPEADGAAAGQRVPSYRDRRRGSTEDHSPEGDISKLLSQPSCCGCATDTIRCRLPSAGVLDAAGCHGGVGGRHV